MSEVNDDGGGEAETLASIAREIRLNMREMNIDPHNQSVINEAVARLVSKRRKIEMEAAAFREIVPYFGRLHVIARHFGWRLGRHLVEGAVDELEQMIARDAPS